MTGNRQWCIAERPTGRRLEESDFTLVDGDVPEPGSGEVLVKTRYLGFDPAQKGWMENVGGYMAPTAIGDVMPGSVIGEVVQSNHPRFKARDKVSGLLGWQEFSVAPGGALQTLPDDELLTANLGALGATGMTAYFGLLEYGVPRPGDVVLVSGAAGATGSMVGQIANIAGCRTIGIAGGAEKCAWLRDEVGYHETIDYKNENVRQRLKALCRESIDIFFDNVGGDILNDGLAHIGMNARVVICGGIARYEKDELPPGPENYFNLVFKRATMRGFIILDHTSEFPLAKQRIRQWIRDGQITYKEDVQKGFENAPKTLMRLFSGRNFGKQLLQL